MTRPHPSPDRLWTARFSVLLTSEAVSYIGAQLALFAFAVVAVTSYGASDSDVALIGTAAGIGTVVFLLVLGPLADVRRKHIALSLLSLLRMAAMLWLVYRLARGESGILDLIVVSGVVAGLTAAYDSTFSAVIPLVVRSGAWARANSWFAGLRSVGDVGAGAVAGLLLARENAMELFALTAGGYALAAVGTALAGRPAAVTPNEEEPRLRDVFAGFRVLFRDPVQRPLTLAVVHFNVFTAAIGALEVLYAIRYAGMDAAGVGVASAIGGALGLLAVLPAAAIVERVRPVVVLTATLGLPAVAGLVIVALPGAPSVLQVVLLGSALGLWAACVLVNVTAVETLKQRLVASDVLGRYSAASRLLTWGVDPLGAGLAAVGVLILPASAVLLLASIGVLGSAAWVVGFGPIRRLTAAADPSADVPSTSSGTASPVAEPVEASRPPLSGDVPSTRSGAVPDGR